MVIFKKRETLVQNIAYMGIMAAINIVFVLLTTLLPVLVFTLVLVLPLTSVIVTIFCEKKYFPIYALATIGLCMIVTIWNISDTFFYVIPSIISGFLFGFLIEKKFPTIYTIIITTVIQFVLSLSLLPLIKLITGIDLLESFLNAFKISDFPYPNILLISFVFFLSLAQETFAFIVIKDELPKLGFNAIEIKANHLITNLCSLISILSTLLFSFVSIETAYGFLYLGIYFSMFELITLIAKKQFPIYIELIVSLIVFIFIFAIIYQNVSPLKGVLVIGLYSLLVTIIGFINNYLLIRNEKDKIDK